ncbi:Bro-N domain-containing protein [Evtepia gabavorous]|uniref:BRO-N domain-containing protein n=1 Tax=Evtepia gabavorous TaxID=2211183 RepID=UPI00399BD8B2
MNELMIFNNPEFGEIRTVEVNGEPWFVGKDVATALGYGEGKSLANAVANHVDEEDKGVTELMTPGGNQKMVIINESGLYSLVLSSKLPGAKKFKRWITSEVIPSIRKHGAYMTPETLEAAIMNPDIMIRLCTVLKEEQDRRKSLEAELDRSKEWYSIKRVAHMNGRSHKDFDWRKLKKASERMGYGVRKIFDANYGEVNIYHMKVWESVYPNMEI